MLCFIAFLLTKQPGESTSKWAFWYSEIKTSKAVFWKSSALCNADRARQWARRLTIIKEAVFHGKGKTNWASGQFKWKDARITRSIGQSPTWREAGAASPTGKIIQVVEIELVATTPGKLRRKPYPRTTWRMELRQFALNAQLGWFVCLSLTLRYRDYIDWYSSKIISRMISLTFLLCRPQHDGSTPKGTPPNFSWNGSGVGKMLIFDTQAAVSLKQYKIESNCPSSYWPLIGICTCTRFRLIPKSMTLDDLGGQ